VFGDCVKRNLLNHNTLSKSVTPQLNDILLCIRDVNRRDTRELSFRQVQTLFAKASKQLQRHRSRLRHKLHRQVKNEGLAKFSGYSRKIEKNDPAACRRGSRSCWVSNSWVARALETQ